MALSIANRSSFQIQVDQAALVSLMRSEGLMTDEVFAAGVSVTFCDIIPERLTLAPGGSPGNVIVLDLTRRRMHIPVSALVTAAWAIGREADFAPYLLLTKSEFLVRTLIVGMHAITLGYQGGTIDLSADEHLLNTIAQCQPLLATDWHCATCAQRFASADTAERASLHQFVQRTDCFDPRAICALLNVRTAPDLATYYFLRLAMAFPPSADRDRFLVTATHTHARQAIRAGLLAPALYQRWLAEFRAQVPVSHFSVGEN